MHRRHRNNGEKSFLHRLVRFICIVIGLLIVGFCLAFAVFWFLYKDSIFLGRTKIENEYREELVEIAEVTGRKYNKCDMDFYSAHNLFLWNKVVELATEVSEGRCTETDLYLDTEELLGKLVFTPEDLGVDRINRSNAGNLAMGLLDFNLDYITNNMVLENPFIYYWFDKTADNKMDTIEAKITKEGNLSFPEKICIHLEVNYDYRKDGRKDQVDPVKVKRALKARDNALKVIEEAASFSDLDKLFYYCDYICDHIVYDREANSTYGDEYGDPWQMISVFDDDPDTNVVCEGYGKAFQFLCDNTDFEGEIYSYLVDGYKNKGKHTWNILHMDDGKYYLADITTCDNNAVPGRRERFLQGASGGNWMEGYTFDAESFTVNGVTYDVPAVTFDYFNTVKKLWLDSILSLSETDYGK